MGDATSLEGGTLLLTPLVGSDGLVYARAQGAVSIGGFDIKTIGGEQVRKNYALVGRVPLGAIVERVPPQPSLAAGDTVYVNLRQPDITTAFRVAEAVNSSFSQPLALAVNPGQIAIAVPDEMKEPAKRMQFLAQLESLEVDPDQRAVVVVNERTGTIVVGKNVVVSEVAIAHGNLSVEISARPIISQPAPFSQGQTVVVPQTQTRVTTEQAKLFALQESASVQDIATALNALGVTPRDLIAIFQALKAAGALNAELIIM
jgi:flagellar P-ring protein precursor FlgI